MIDMYLFCVLILYPGCDVGVQREVRGKILEVICFSKKVYGKFSSSEPYSNARIHKELNHG